MIYVYTHYVCIHIYIYIYIYNVYVYVYIYIYIYIYIQLYYISGGLSFQASRAGLGLIHCMVRFSACGHAPLLVPVLLHACV